VDGGLPDEDIVLNLPGPKFSGDVADEKGQQLLLAYLGPRKRVARIGVGGVGGVGGSIPVRSA